MWHLTLHRWTGDRAEAMKLLERHRSWMRHQQLAGRIIVAGPTPDREMGIMVFGHMTRAELDEISACRSGHGSTRTPRGAAQPGYGGASPQPQRGTGASGGGSAPGRELASAIRVPHST